MLFSHEVIRPSQKELVETVAKALKDKKNVLAHAPTGLGKTAAVLCPALELALQRDLTVFFLTSRHTQHKIVLETAKQIMDRNNVRFSVASLIGKKWMCAQENVQTMHSGDFSEYCKSLVEGNQCEFYINARGKNNILAQKVLAEMKVAPLASETVMLQSIQEKLCPYEMSLMLAEDSKVIVADYFYLFHPNIRETLLNKIKKKIEQAIIIVDEGHNLPSRVRDLLTFRLSNKTMRFAIQEAKKYNIDVACLVEIQEALNKLSANVAEERLVKKEQFTEPLSRFKPYDEIVAELELAADMVRNEKRTSHIGAVAKFLQEWDNQEGGFARIISKKDMLVTLSNRCLDPAILTKEVFDSCYSAVIMSGTLSPTGMYADVLGVQDAVAKSFPSPFSEENRLTLIVPRTTTKFTLRSEKQYREIASVCADLANRIPGCVMIFFPSYGVRDSVAAFFTELYSRTAFFETPGMDKAAKQDLLDRFSRYAKSGAALLGVAAGSFGEGIDLPGILKGVIVVGLPLDKPDLETTELISYYDKKFGKGWEYGYILPAMTRCIQNAGRCIRTENDRGVLAFVDERYAWPRYRSCFPPEWKMKISIDYAEEIAGFF